MNFLLSILLALLLSTQPVRADNPTTVSFGCAPWDGPTLDINIGIPDMTLNVSIWAKGYDDLHKGKKTIVINNKYASSGVTNATGRARTLGTMIPQPEGVPSYREVSATVHFDKLEMKEGGIASGYVQVKGSETRYPFEGPIAARMPCG